MVLYVENLGENPLGTFREKVQLSLLSTRMHIKLPAEKALHANRRNLAVYFVLILFLHSFPKHLLVI